MRKTQNNQLRLLSPGHYGFDLPDHIPDIESCLLPPVASLLNNNEILELLADKLEKYSCADIEQLVDESAHKAYIQRKNIVYETIDAIIKKWRASVNDEQIQKLEEWGKKYANLK